MDLVFLHEFRLSTLIGIYPWERKVPQTIELNLDIGLSSSLACSTDKVSDTIDYAEVVQRIRDSLAQRHFCLAEALAEHVAQLLLREFDSPFVRVSVTKLGLMNGVKRLGVVIERSR